MAKNRKQRRAAGDYAPMNKQELTPEQLQQKIAEEQMEAYIQDNGIEAMVELQIKMKCQDIEARIAATENIKSWLEVSSMVVQFQDMGLELEAPNEDYSLSDIISLFQDFKVNLYKKVKFIYDSLSIDDFEEGKSNPFSLLWEEFANNRKTPDDALREFYAWEILQDPVIWSNGMAELVWKERAKERFEALEAESE